MRYANLFASALGCFVAAAAHAQSWPTKPIHVLVGQNPGTFPDVAVRTVGPEMGKRLGQPIVVETRPGAGGEIARQAVTRSEPDGYLLLITGLPIAGHPIFLKAGYIVGKDLTPVANLVSSPQLIFSRTEIARTWPELVAYGKANPKKLNFGAQTLSLTALMGFTAKQAGFDYTAVNYKGAPVAEMLRGEVDFYVGSLSNLAPHIQSGKIAPVLTYSPLTAYPNVPTATSLGLTKSLTRSLQGLYGPPGLPNNVARSIAQAVEAATNVPAVREALLKTGGDVLYLGPEQMMKEYEAQMAVYSEAARALNIQPE